MFKVLNPNDLSDLNYLSQMHNLRYRVFHERLRWKNGLHVFSMMEFDEYDHKDALYLVRINGADQVDACVRLTATTYPYLLGHSFPDYICEVAVPKSGTIFEASRFCADSVNTPRNIAGQIMLAMLEYGLANHVEQFVSLSDHKMVTIVNRYGWASQKLGPLRDTGTDISVALQYTVTKAFRDKVSRSVGLSHALEPSILQTTFEPGLNSAIGAR